MLLYELTGLVPDGTFPDALTSAGVPVEDWFFSTRRFDEEGKVIPGEYPLALFLPNADASHYDAVHAAYLAHVPFHNHVANQTANVKRIARRKISHYVDSVDLQEATMFMLHVLWKLSQSQALTAAEQSRLPAVAKIRDDVMALRSAAVAIIAELSVLTDAEAGVFDVEGNAAWPAL